jgi:hypothetical protein
MTAALPGLALAASVTINTITKTAPRTIAMETSQGCFTCRLAERSRGHISSHGRSAVNISSFAKGASGEHRRHDTNGIRLEIDAGASDTPAASQAGLTGTVSIGCSLAFLCSAVRAHGRLQRRQLCGSLSWRRRLLSWGWLAGRGRKRRFSSKFTACAEHEGRAHEYRQNADHRHSVRPSRRERLAIGDSDPGEGYLRSDSGGKQ